MNVSASASARVRVIVTVSVTVKPNEQRIAWYGMRILGFTPGVAVYFTRKRKLIPESCNVCGFVLILSLFEHTYHLKL